jgi:hypothetical protein
MPPRPAIATSSCHLSNSATTSAIAPNAPMRESCMMRSTSSRCHAPPKASTQSASPSSWKAPVSSSVVVIPSSTATPGGHHSAAPQVTNAPAPPTSSPTSGK